MPTVKTADAEIYYEVVGQGFPILTFAPKGLMSTCDAWDLPGAILKPPYDYADEFMVISMDQRNAGGKSHAPLSPNTDWADYARDQIAVLDDLGIERCHLYGQCIGGAFIAKLLQMAPKRIASAVLAQPIGRKPGDKFSPEWPQNFQNWVNVVKEKIDPSVSDELLNQIYKNLYRQEFGYSVPKVFYESCPTPTLVLAGNDAVHPFEVSKEIADMLPNCQGFIEQWKEGESVDQAREKVREFFRANSV